MAEKVGIQNGPNRRRKSTGQVKSPDNTKIPIYLRASTGSCHDFCKYGGRKLVDDAKPKIFVQSSVVAVKKNIPVVKDSTSRISVSSQKQFPPKSRFLNRGPTVLLRKPSLKKITVICKQGVPKKNQKHSVARISKNGNPESYRNHKPERRSSYQIKNILSSRLDSSYHPNSLRFSHKDIDECDSNDDQKDRDLENRRNRETVNTKSSIENPSPTESSSPHLFRSSRDLNEQDYEENEEEHGTPENSRYLNSDNSTASSFENPSTLNSPSQDEIEQESEAEEPTKTTKTSMTQNLGLIRSEKEVASPVKLKFRRGKVIDVQCVGGNAVGRKSYGKRVSGGDHHHPKIRDGEKIVLRHQDAEEKKDDNRCLFNDVIEETASKLVETRKSKVKALVGAFETVISLQDK